LCLATGILLGMLYYRQTGLACGGIITPGVVAMYVHEPAALGVSLAAGLATALLLEGLVRLSGVYGRQRLAAALLIALALRFPVVAAGGDASLWLGWVVPGLVGADLQRQGVVDTLVSVVAVSLATVMAVQLLSGLLP
jgi:poly-gamma-glutamate biosynthesis protein PgsC/CapC